MMKDINEDRETQIRELAECVSEQFCSVGRFDPAIILKTYDITISHGWYGQAFDGMLEHSNSLFHIYCNLERLGTSTSPRALFTIGHELGHYFIDEHRIALSEGRSPAHMSLCEYESPIQVEREADLFASHLLMPSSRFLRTARRYPRGLAGILEIAKEFGTSLTSTAIRYAKAEIVPCVVLKWKGNSVAWHWISTETFRHRISRTIRSASDLPSESATQRILAGEKVSTFLQTGSVGSAWFPDVRWGDNRDAIIIEQCVSLGRYGALTFLFPESGSFSSAS